jgi:hypothetical protein
LLTNEEYKIQFEEYKNQSVDFNEWKIMFSSFPRHLEIILDTSVYLGEKTEIWVEYEGLTFRWINSYKNWMPKLIVPVEKMDESTREDELARNFLSQLSFRLNKSIRIWSSSCQVCRYVPIHLQDYLYGPGLVLPSVDFPAKRPALEKTKFALSLYREGLGSEEGFYKFLCFYKIIQLAFKDLAPDMKTSMMLGIGRYLNKLMDPNIQERINKIKTEHPDIGAYFYEQGRNAITHIDTDVVSPDRPGDVFRINSDAHVIKELAKLLIEEGLLGDTEAI